MRLNRKSLSSAKNSGKNRSSSKSATQLHSAVSGHTPSTSLQKVLSANQKSMSQYSFIIEELNSINHVESAQIWGNNRKSPYRLPIVYSLEKQANRLGVRKKRLLLLEQIICRDITESIRRDWINVGGDINGAIRTIGSNYSNRTNRTQL